MSLCLRPINVKVSRLLAPAAINGLLKVPCGNCQNCVINNKRILQNRLILEACSWSDSCHVALTYNDESLPRQPYIDVKTTQIFIKRLRYFINEKERYRKIKYYICGEYGFGGDRPWNPHYHAILYGVHHIDDWPQIAKAWTKNKKLKCDMEQLKPVELTPELAAYACGYVAQKAKDENNRWTDRNQAFMYAHFPKEKLPFANWSTGLGLDAARKMKAAIKKYENISIKTVNTGKRKYPLGRYLKEFTDGTDICYLNSGGTIKNHIPYAQKIVNLKLSQMKFIYKLAKTREVRKGKYSTDRRTL